MDRKTKSPIPRRNDTPSTRGGKHTANLRRATLLLGFLYQFMQFVISNTLWASLGYDPIAILPITLILMLSGTLISYAVAAVLFYFRDESIFIKLLLSSALSLGAGAINASVDLISRGLVGFGTQDGSPWASVNFIVIYSTAQFLGWAFLYGALLANFELRDRR